MPFELWSLARLYQNPKHVSDTFLLRGILVDMEELQKKHRQEQKDLQGRVTQRKKQATKKTRKGVNDECAELERQLKEKQAEEIKALGGENDPDSDSTDEEHANSEEETTSDKSKDLNASMNVLSLSSNPSTNGSIKKPNRQKARLARRAAEQEAAVEEAKKEAESVPDLRERERQCMREAYEQKGLTEQEIRSDGHCLYAAIADQLQDHGISLAPKMELEIPEFDKSPATLRYKSTRQVAASYILQHRDDFQPFLDSSLDQYVKNIRDTGEWGGHLEIQALANAYGVDINVLRGDGRVETIGSGEKSNDPLWLAYYRHSYGLGEHYNSLRRAKP